MFKHIEIRGPLILIHGKHRMALLNWQTDCGFEALLSLDSDDPLSGALWPGSSEIVRRYKSNPKTYLLIYLAALHC